VNATASPASQRSLRPPLVPTGACAVVAQDQIQRRDRRAEPAGALTCATARGAGTSKSAFKAATALTIHRFMVFASPSWVQPQKDASTECSGLP
jgi:hypothetical protein